MTTADHLPASTPDGSADRSQWRSRTAYESLKSIEHELIPALRERIEAMPKAMEWDNAWHEDRKRAFLTDFLSEDAYIIMTTGDNRTHPKKTADCKLDEELLETPYHNPILPDLEPIIRAGVRTPDALKKALAERGGLDRLVDELTERDMETIRKYKYQTNYKELASSTGTRQTIERYKLAVTLKFQMLDALTVTAVPPETFFSVVRSRQDGSIRTVNETHQRDVVAIHTQTGTDTELLNPIFGITRNIIATEAGSGTKNASWGKYWDTRGWMGHTFKKDETIPGFEGVSEPFTLALRDEHNVPVPSKVLKENIIRNLNETTDVVGLHVITGSKTGLGKNDWGGLSLRDAIAIRAKYPDRVRIIVDDAQNRLPPKKVKKLFDLNIMVNTTGSKASEGPMFSHVLLVPKALLALTEDNHIPSGLDRFVTQSDLSELKTFWETEPERYKTQLSELASLSDMPDVVSLLKWEQPIETLRQFWVGILPEHESERAEVEYHLMNAIYSQIRYYIGEPVHFLLPHGLTWETLNSAYMDTLKTHHSTIAEKQQSSQSDRLSDMAALSDDLLLMTFMLSHKDGTPIRTKDDMAFAHWLLSHDIANGPEDPPQLGRQFHLSQTVQEGNERPMLRISPSMNQVLDVYRMFRRQYNRQNEPNLSFYDWLGEAVHAMYAYNEGKPPSNVSAYRDVIAEFSGFLKDTYGDMAVKLHWILNNWDYYKNRFGVKK